MTPFVNIKVAELKYYTEKKQLAKAYQALPKMRQMKADACINFESYRQCVMSGYLLSLCMSEQGISNATINIMPGGKPYFDLEAPLFFNISHTKECVICAVASENIGVDIEKIRPYKEKVARKAFSPSDYEELKEQIGSTKNLEFTRLWTKYESRIKMTGKGLAHISYKELSDEDRKNYDSIFVHSFQYLNSYYISIATKSSIDEKSIKIDLQ